VSLQAGSVKAVSAPALVQLAKATALSVALGMCVAVLPVAPLIVPFLALPFAYMFARSGIFSAAIVAVLTGGLVYVGAGPNSAVLVFLLVVGVGGAIGWAVRSRWRFGRSFAVATGAAVGALVLWGVFVWLVLGVTLTELHDFGMSWIGDFVAQGGVAGMSSESVQAWAGQMRTFVDIVPYLAPGLLGLGAMLLAACSLGLARLFFPRMRDKVAVNLWFKQFRMRWGVAYLSIAGLAMLLVSRSDGRWSEIVLYVGINLLLVSQTLFFLQGLAVAHWFAVDRQMRGGRRVTLYVVAVLAHLLFQLTGLFGLFDTWVDYRKRFARKSPGTGALK